MDEEPAGNHHEHHHLHEHHRGWSPAGGRRRWLEPFVLVLLAGGEAHGYAMIGRLNDLGLAPAAIEPGQLYRTLRDLEAAGLVRSSWQMTATGAPRRAYGLTGCGRAALDDWATVMRERARLVEEFLARFERAKEA